MDLTPLISSFGIIAIAEFGDKTQLAAITLSARHKPVSVFLGAMLAILLVDGLSVLVGGALAGLLPMFWVGVGSGLVFILFGAYTLLSRGEEEVRISGHKFAFVTSFSLVALMELGDKTQFAAIALAARCGSPALIFAGIVLAYLIVMGAGVIVGASLLRLVPMRYIRICASAAFILFGIAFLSGAIAGVMLP